MLESKQDVRIQSVALPTEIGAPFDHHAYAVLVVAGEAMSRLEIAGFCRRIVATPCRYAVSWGVDCQAWEYLLDLAFIEAHPDCEPLLMTTAHPEEPLPEAVWFFRNSTTIDHLPAQRWLVLLVRVDEQLATDVRDSVREHFHIRSIRE